MIINTDKIRDVLENNAFTFNCTVRIRTAPYIEQDNDTGIRYNVNETVYYDSVVTVPENNFLWLHYLSLNGNLDRYIACGQIEENGDILYYGYF